MFESSTADLLSYIQKPKRNEITINALFVDNLPLACSDITGITWKRVELPNNLDMKDLSEAKHYLSSKLLQVDLFKSSGGCKQNMLSEL